MQRGQLVAERLARAGRHDHEHVAVRQRGADRVLLPGAEARGSRTARAAPRAGRVARATGSGGGGPEAGQGEGRGGFHGPPDITPGSGGFCGAEGRGSEPLHFAQSAVAGLGELLQWSSTTTSRSWHGGCARSSARTCSRSTPAARTRSAPTSTAAATSTSPRWWPSRSTTATKRALVEALRHEALPCPARGLELVVYPLATARSGGGEPGFELNLNTGARHGLPRRRRAGRHRGLLVRDRPLDPARARDRAPRPAGRRADRADPARRRCCRCSPSRCRWHRDSRTPLAGDVILNTARDRCTSSTPAHWISKPEARAAA